MTEAQVAELYGCGGPQDLDNMSFASPVWWCALGDGDAIGAGNMIDLTGGGYDGEFLNGESGDFVSDVPGSTPILEDWQTQAATTVAGGVSDYSYNTNDGTPTNMEDADFTDVILASELMPDLSGNGYVGTPTNMENADFQIDTPGGRSRRSSLFDGVNEYITMGDVLGFEYDEPFSVSCWFKSTSTTTRHMVSKTDGSSGWLLTLAVGQVRWKLVSSSGGSSCGIITTPTYNDGAWHHVVATYSASTPGSVADMAVYIDGSLATTTTESDPLGSNTIANSASFNVSGRTDGSALFPGSIDDVTVYDRELTLDEVQEIYNGGLPRENRSLNSASNIVGYWLMGDLTAGGSSHFATRFDGVNEYVTMGDVLGFEYTEAFSISHWIKTTDTNAFTVCKSTIGSNQYRGYGVGLNAGYVDWRLRSDNATNNQIHAIGTTLVNDGDWHHVVVTWDGNASPGAAGLHIYVDGGPDEAVPDIDNLSATITSTAPFNLGIRNNVDNPYAGSLSDVAIYDKELSAVEIVEIYNNGIPIDVTAAIDRTDLVGYWRMGEGDGNPTTLSNGGTITTDSSITSYIGNEATIDVDGSDSLGVNIDGNVIDIGGLGWTPSIAESSIEVIMQAVDSVTSAVYTWTVPVPDFAGEHYPGPNNPTQIAIRAIKGFP
jgi:hypothetical protein